MSSLDFRSKLPLHQQIAEKIMDMIVRKGCRRGDPLPSYRELAARFDVSVLTVKRGMSQLIETGAVFAIPAKGTFVNQEPVATSRQLSRIGLICYCSQKLFFSATYMQEIFRGIMEQAEGLEAEVRIFPIKGKGVLTAAEIQESGVDGVLLLGVANDEYLKQYVRCTMPAVVVDYLNDSLALDFVVCENAGAAEQVTSNLLDRGHRRIGYVSGWSTDPVATGGHKTRPDPMIETSDNRERRDGFLKAMNARGLSADRDMYALSESGAERGIAEIVSKQIKNGAVPTAWIADNTEIACELIQEFKSNGLRIPEDVSVASVAGAEDIVVDGLRLTHTRMPFMEMGRQAVRMLRKRCQRLRPLKTNVKRMKGEFIEGNSVKVIDR